MEALGPIKAGFRSVLFISSEVNGLGFATYCIYNNNTNNNNNNDNDNDNNNNNSNNNNNN